MQLCILLQTTEFKNLEITCHNFQLSIKLKIWKFPVSNEMPRIFYQYFKRVREELVVKSWKQIRSQGSNICNTHLHTNSTMYWYIEREQETKKVKRKRSWEINKYTVLYSQCTRGRRERVSFVPSVQWSVL